MVANWLKFSTPLQCFQQMRIRSAEMHVAFELVFHSFRRAIDFAIEFRSFYFLPSRSFEEIKKSFHIVQSLFGAQRASSSSKLNEWMNSPSSFCLNRLFYLPFVFCLIVYGGTWLGLTHFYLFDFPFIFVHFSFSLLRYNRTCSLFDYYYRYYYLLFERNKSINSLRVARRHWHTVPVVFLAATKLKIQNSMNLMTFGCVSFDERL